MNNNTLENKEINNLVTTSETFRNVKKMFALFVIDREKHIATTDLNPTSLWIFNEPAAATIKRDGTNISVLEDGSVWARRQVKHFKTAPDDFILAETDPNTGNMFGIEPMESSGFKRFIREAIQNHEGELTPGTYELVGPKLQNNAEGLDRHILIKHGTEVATEIPDMRTINPDDAHNLLMPIFEDFKNRGIEGIVWAGSDGKRVKLRTKDFFGDPNSRR